VELAQLEQHRMVVVVVAEVSQEMAQMPQVAQVALAVLAAAQVAVRVQHQATAAQEYFTFFTDTITNKESI
jgi:hypothetical protein